MKIVSSPVYLDTSALAKIYIAERDSDALEAALAGRRDLMVSDLAATELISALARRVRAGDLELSHASRVHTAILRDLSEGHYRWIEATRQVYRDAEQLLLDIGLKTPLRAADAIHLAHARQLGARTLLTFDSRLAAAARTVIGVTVLPA